MCYTAQQICAQVAHLIMQLKYKANTHTQSERTNKMVGKPEGSAQCNMHIYPGPACKIRKEIMQQMPPGNTQLPFYPSPFPSIISISPFCCLSLWVVPLHFCGICIISSMSYVSALCALRLLRWLCASRGSAGDFCNHRHYQVA